MAFSHAQDVNVYGGTFTDVGGDNYNVNIGISITEAAPEEEPLPDALPVKPAIFCGRDDLVRNAVQLLLSFRHVALVGGGGIGKTSIARAVINDNAISEMFAHRRYFVSYDDMDVSQITYETFLDRIGRALGISSKPNIHSLISKVLSSSRILLVLDNAETFLDAENDAGRIADCIDQFGARSQNVVIMLTTRTAGLPPNLLWERLQVPVLEISAASEAFNVIYRLPMDSSTLRKLLSAVEFHPLSINLLAQVAVQNEWSPEEPVAAWDHQRALLLENGTGKIHSIAATVEMSLNSPSLKEPGDTVRHLLQVIAFLPQGISKTRLADMFPADLDVGQCAELLCKHSLAYHKEEFITMLAPIRLYISRQYNDASPARMPLLSKVKVYYYARLDDDPVDAALIRSEDINIERVVAVGLARCTKKTIRQALFFTSKFVFSLTHYKPRPTALVSVVSALQIDGTSPKSASRWNLLKTKNTPVLLAKASCLADLGFLALSTGRCMEGRELYELSQKTSLACGFRGRVYLKLTDINIGNVYRMLGNYVKAEQAYELGLRRRTSFLFGKHTNRLWNAYINCCLGLIKTWRGEPGAVDLCLSDVKWMEGAGYKSDAASARYHAGFAEMMLGKYESAKHYFDTALSGDEGKEYSRFHLFTLTAIADVLYCQGKTTECHEVHQRVRDIIQHSPNPDASEAIEALCVIAAYTAMEGDVGRARELIQPIMNKIDSPVIHIGWRSMIECYYLAACVELRGNDLQVAKKLFAQTIESCKGGEEYRIRARALRALGEIAFREQDIAGAKDRFEEAKGLCGFAGVKPKFLYAGYSCYMLSDTFTGWTLFQEGRFPTVSDS